MIRRDVFDWLEGLKTAEKLSARHAHSCFHAQQATEKAFKALIIYVKKIVHRSHDLVELCDEIKDGLRLNSSTESALPELSAYYTQSRYPNAGLRRPSIEIGGEQARKSISIAREVVDAVDRYFGAKV